MTVTEAAPEAPITPEKAGRWSSVGRSVLHAMRRAPFSLAYLAVLWVIPVVTGSLHGPSASLLGKIGVGIPSLMAGHWWTPFTAGLWSSSLGSLLFKTFLFLIIMVPAERRLGVARTFGILFAGQVVGALLGVGFIKLGEVIGEPWMSTLTKELDVGPGTGLMAVGFALSCTLTALWRRRVRLALAMFILVTALYIGHIQEVVRMGGAIVGLLAGVFMFGAAKPQAWRASHHETRVLVAITIAMSAIGALLASLVDNPNGPLATFSFLFSVDGMEAGEVDSFCRDQGATSDDCSIAKLEHMYGQGLAMILGIMPVAFLLVLAEGLRRGKKLAWWLTLLFTLTILALELWMLRTAADGPWDGFSAKERVQWYVSAAEALVLPVLTIVMLLWTRRHFDLTSGRRAGLQLLAAVIPAILVTGAVYTQFGLIFRDQFAPQPSLGDLFADLPARFSAPAYIEVFDVKFLPTGTMGRLLFIYLFLAFWLVVLFALLSYFLKTRVASEEGAELRARRLLEQGGSTLSYMSTWPGNAHWFSSDGKATIAYRAIGGVAVTLGDPYGDLASRDQAVAEFASYCSDNGWTPCFYSVTSGVRDVTDAMGWSSVQVAEDTIVPLRELEFKGKKWQDIRTALNKAKKDGIHAEWYTFPSAPIEVTTQIRELSEEWVADKGLPEMGFTLGGLEELNDPAVRCLVAIDDDRHLHGVTSWMPVYRDGSPVGWTLDFMRRRDDGFKGVMEFLIASAALGFKEDGAEFLSLSGAPLARLDRGETPTTLQRFLDLTGKIMEPVYGFRSLLNFKAKFQPEYQPLYVAYPDPAALPSIGNAIGRAYVPDLNAAQAVKLLQKLR